MKRLLCLLILVALITPAHAFVWSSVAEKTLEQMLDGSGKLSVLTLNGRAAPALSPSGQGRIYFDSSANVFKLSVNGGAYATLSPGGGTVTGGTCTSQAVTAISTTGVPTCTTLTSAYVDSTIAQVAAANIFTLPQKITGSTDATQFTILANATQSITSPLFRFYASNGTTELMRIHADDANSVFIGAIAGNASVAPTYSVAVGFHALTAVTTGTLNTAIGYNSLSALTTGAGNMGVGASTLTSITTANFNTAIGYNSLVANTASNNTGIGFAALTANTSGTQQVAIGYQALKAVTTAAANTAVGYNVLQASTGSSSTGVGSTALQAATTGVQNTGIGSQALLVVTTGGINTALGYNAGATVLTTGSRNTLIAGGASTVTTPAAGTNDYLNIGNTLIGDFAGKHYGYTGTAPAVSNTTANSCGTTAATLVGTDQAGKVTVGATAGTSCTVTFATAFANAPACVVNNETTANLARATSTTTTAVLAGTFVAGDVLSYQCPAYF